MGGDETKNTGDGPDEVGGECCGDEAVAQERAEIEADSNDAPIGDGDSTLAGKAANVGLDL